MSELEYSVDARIARLTLNRPRRGNGLTRGLITELEKRVEQADLDPEVRVLVLAGRGKGFCGGYDLVDSAEGLGAAGRDEGAAASGPAPGEPAGAGARAGVGSPLDPAVMAANHDPRRVWDPMVDYAMMRRNVRSFMSLFECSKPVICMVHGFCVAGGTDLALCSDLLVIAADAQIGYPPARAWGSPTTAMWAHRLGPQRAKRLLFTGDCLSGLQALEWGLAVEAPAPEDLERTTESLAARIAQVPLNQLQMMKLLVNQTLHEQGLRAGQTLGTLLDGTARHTPEGYAFQARAARDGFREAVRERDEPFAG